MTPLATTTTSELALLVRLLSPPPDTLAILVIDAGGSQIAFAFGQYGGDFSTFKLRALIDSSNGLANMLSRS
jgi:hypothetical protein